MKKFITEKNKPNPDTKCREALEYVYKGYLANENEFFDWGKWAIMAEQALKPK